MAGGVEVVVDDPGSGHHQARAHGAHLGIGKGVDIVRVPEGVELYQLLDNSLGRMLMIRPKYEAVRVRNALYQRT